jgi:hypothetical protein
MAGVTGVPEVGQNVFAIGAPKGLEFSLSRGVVSQLRSNGDLVQTDAALNSGNSGGPLLDEQGLNFALSRQLIKPFLAPAIARAPSQGSKGQTISLKASGPPCFFQSYKTGEGEEISCSLSSRVNNNGHTVYDVAWADGYRSSYVFWANGQVEIHANGAGAEPDAHTGEFEQFRDGVAIVSTKGSITFLPGLTPLAN